MSSWLIAATDFMTSL